MIGKRNFTAFDDKMFDRQNNSLEFANIAPPVCAAEKAQLQKELLRRGKNNSPVRSEKRNVRTTYEK